VATTNRDLAAEAAAGRFRQDLFFRLSVIPVRIPPLRERLDDIPVLAHRFALRAAADAGKDVAGISAEALALLQQHEWPGNVRELQHVIERAVILSSDPILQARSLDQDTFKNGRAAAPVQLVSTNGATSGAASGALRDGVVLTSLSLDDAEEVLIAKALEVTGQNRTRAAALLGISVRTLRYKLNGPPSAASEAADD